MANGEIRPFIGDYSDYEAALKEQERQRAAAAQNKKEVTEKKETSAREKMTYKEKLEYKDIEMVIAGVEAEIKMWEMEINRCGNDFERLAELNGELEKAMQRLDELMERWAYLSELAEDEGI